MQECSQESAGWFKVEVGPTAHPEHALHVRDAGGVPAGDVGIELLQFVEEFAHVGDVRDVPAAYGATSQ